MTTTTNSILYNTAVNLIVSSKLLQKLNNLHEDEVTASDLDDIILGLKTIQEASYLVRKAARKLNTTPREQGYYYDAG